MKTILRGSFAVFLCCCFYLESIAQKSGRVTGVVRDLNTEEPIIGATLRLKGIDSLFFASDLDGKFSMSAPVGTYTLTATSIGYDPVSLYNLVVGSGNDLILTVALPAARYTLNELVVKADNSRSARASDMVTPMSTQRLTTEEIKMNPGGNFDVSRVIQVLPGVAGGFTASRNDIIVRGGAPNENVYYLDGIEIPVLNHFQTQGASGGATGILNVSFIEDVRLSSSAFDARYDNALAATFVIKQRNGNPDKLSGNLRLSGTELAATLEGPLSEKTTFLASARRSYLQYLFSLLDIPIRPNYWDFQYKIAHQLNPKTTLNLIGLGAIDQFRLSPPKNSTLENEYILRSNPTIDQWNYTVGGSLKRLIRNGYYTVAVSRNMFVNKADRFDDEQVRTLGLESFEAENKLRIDVNKFKDGWKWSYGLSGQFVRYQTTLFNQLAQPQLDAAGEVVVPAVVVNFGSEIDFFRYGAYGQASRYFLDQRLLLSLGARNDLNTFTRSGNNPLRTLSPRLSFSYQLNDKVDFTGSIGRYFKCDTRPREQLLNL